MSLSNSGNQTFSPPTASLPCETAELLALAGHVKAGRCALFVGAGLSAPAGLPTWGALMQQLVEQATPWAVDLQLVSSEINFEDGHADLLAQPDLAPLRNALGARKFQTLCRRVQKIRKGRLDLQTILHAIDTVYRDSSDRAELQRLSEAKRYTEMAEHCRTRLGRDSFHALVSKTLSAPGVLPPTHKDIVRTPFSCVVTTNFDTLLEQAYARYAGFVPRAPTGAELGQQGTLLLDRAFYILKAHGDAARPETMVFTADDYRRIIHATPAFQAVMSGILLTHAVLFVGYSLNDPNFRLLLDNQLTVFSGHVPPRYALLEGVGVAEADILWRTAKVRVLSYPPKQHQEVGRFLAALADKVAPPLPAASEIRVAPKSGEIPATLRIHSDGRVVSYELEQRSKAGSPRLFGSGPHPATSASGDLLRAADARIGREQSPRDQILAIGKWLADSFPPNLKLALRNLPANQTLEIACSPMGTRVPWEWLDAGKGPLCSRCPVIRQPVTITHQARGRRLVRSPFRALVVGDAGDACGGMNLNFLEFAELEAQAIEALLLSAIPGAVVTRLSRENATRDRVLAEMKNGNYDLIHFGGHAWFFESEAYFYTWDEIVLGTELASLLADQPPALMFLNTHYTAFVLSEVVSPGRGLVLRHGDSADPNESPRGFAEAAMRIGVSAFVGAFGTLADRPAAEFAVTFYDHLLRGVTVAEALLAARRRSATSAADSGLFYTAYGYPDFHLVNARQAGKVKRPSLGRIKRQMGWSGD